MQTVNNNFTVEALVAKYRNFVDEHCPKESYWDPKEGNISGPLDPIDCYAEAHLLVTLYKRIAWRKIQTRTFWRHYLNIRPLFIQMRSMKRRWISWLITSPKFQPLFLTTLLDKYTKGWIR